MQANKLRLLFGPEAQRVGRMVDALPTLPFKQFLANQVVIAKIVQAKQQLAAGNLDAVADLSAQVMTLVRERMEGQALWQQWGERLLDAMRPKEAKPPKIRVRPCSKCKQEFIPTAKRRFVCSDACAVIRPKDPKPPRPKPPPKMRPAGKGCETCLQRYKKKTKNQRFCSTWCRDRAMFERRRAARQGERQEAQCKICGATFTMYNREHRVCSMTCRLEYRRKKPIEGKACAHCGGRFDTANSLRQYCSALCHKDAKTKRQREKTQPAERSCVACQKVFLPCTPYSIAKTCGDACRAVWRAEQSRLRCRAYRAARRTEA